MIGSGFVSSLALISLLFFADRSTDVPYEAPMIVFQRFVGQMLTTGGTFSSGFLLMFFVFFFLF